MGGHQLSKIHKPLGCKIVVGRVFLCFEIMFRNVGIILEYTFWRMIVRLLYSSSPSFSLLPFRPLPAVRPLPPLRPLRPGLSLSSILQYWRGRAQVRDLKIRFVGAHLGQGFRDTLDLGVRRLGIW